MSSREPTGDVKFSSGDEFSWRKFPLTGTAQEEYSDGTPESEPLYKPSDTEI